MCRPTQPNHCSNKSTTSQNCSGSSNGTDTFTVPTFRDEPAQVQVDVSTMTETELEELRATDPFMYYSIRSRSEGAPAVVTRRSCVSVEKHADTCLEELFNQMQGMTFDDDDDSFEGLDEDFDYLTVVTSLLQADNDKQ